MIRCIMRVPPAIWMILVMSHLASANPLLEPWSGPFGGVPAFDRARIADFEPALEAAMAEQLAAIERIATDPTPPTFENTVAASERSGRTLDRVQTIYGVYGSNLSDDAVQEVERRMAPRLAAFQDRIVQNKAFFDRVTAVHESADKAGLSPEQRRSAWLLFTNLTRAGARLGPGEQAELAAINQQLAELPTLFAQNVLKE